MSLSSLCAFVDAHGRVFQLSRPNSSIPARGPAIAGRADNSSGESGGSGYWRLFQAVQYRSYMSNKTYFANSTAPALFSLEDGP